MQVEAEMARVRTILGWIALGLFVPVLGHAATIVSATLSIAASSSDPGSKVYINGNLVAPAAAWDTVNTLAVPPSWLIPGGSNLIAAMFTQAGTGGVGLSYKLVINYDSGPSTEIISQPGGGNSILTCDWPIQDASGNPWFVPAYSTAAGCWSSNTVTAYASNCSATWPSISYSGGTVPYIGYAGGCTATGTNLAFRQTFSLGPQVVATPTPFDLCTMSTKTVVSASFSISGDDKVDTYINGNYLGMTPSDYSYTQVYTYPIPVGWLNSGSSNVIATTNYDLHGGDMGTSYKLVLSYSDGSIQEIISDPTQNPIQYYYDGYNTPGPLSYPPMIGGLNWYDAAYSPGAGWSGATVDSAQKCFAQWSNITYSGGMVPWMGSGFCDTVLQYQTWSFRQTFNLCTFTTPSVTPTPTPTDSPVPCAFIQRLHAGGPAYTDGSGNVWAADQAYSVGGYGYLSGTTYSTVNAIAGTSDAGLYQSVRQYPNLEYEFTVPNGSYLVTLKFAEIYFTAPNQRIFDMSIQGSTVISNLDLAAVAGPFTAYDLTFQVAVTTGVLDIAATPVLDQAIINAIQIQSLTSFCSPTPTGSATWTPTGTPSFSPSPTPSATPSVTATLTPSETPSNTATTTATPSVTGTDTPTPTPTWTPTFSGTSTFTPSPSPSFSSTATDTPTLSPSFTPSATWTATPTVTPSATLSPSFTATPSPSGTPTITPTDSTTDSPTDTPTPTDSPTQSQTSSSTPTLTPSPSPTATATVTPSATVTSTFTSSPTITQTFTVTLTPVPMPDQIVVSVYNAAGERVRQLFNGAGQAGDGIVTMSSALLPEGADSVHLSFPGLLSNGTQELSWDGTNDQGQYVAGGQYYLKVEFHDPYGSVTASIQGVAVVDARPQQRLCVYNSAGEQVAVILLPASMGMLDDFSVTSPGVAGAASVPGSGVILSLHNSQGQTFAYTWDGDGSLGAPLASGVYTVQLTRAQPGASTLVVSRQLNLVKGPALDSAASAQLAPDPVVQGGQVDLRYQSAGGWGRAKVYDLAGELVGQASDTSSSGHLALTVGRLAAGIYLVDFEAGQGEAVLSRRELKLAIVR